MPKTEANKKFQIYNSLFLNLYYQDSNHVGYLLPLLKRYAKSEIEKEKNPIEIIDQFCEANNATTEKAKIDFMFKAIQYVERQIVLFDSIEDSVSPYELEDQKGFLIDDVFSKISGENRDDALIEKLNSFKTRIVLTAHPTQFYRPPVLDIISKLRGGIAQNNIEHIDLLLHQLGLTSLVNSKSPTPFEEAKNIIHICRFYYYDAIGDFIYELAQEHPEVQNYDLIKLGFWPCGDRDGNPFVNYQTTKDVIDALRMTLMKCYYNDLKVLGAKLTFKNVEGILNELKEHTYKAMFDSTYHVAYTGILQNLKTVETILIDQYESLYLEDLQKLIYKVRIFKNHFASLDIRQDSSVHIRTINYLLKTNGLIKESYEELPTEQLVTLLTSGQLDIPQTLDSDPQVTDTIQNISQLKSIQESNGEAGCHRYIISNSEDIFSVLFVFGMMRWVTKSEKFNFDIIPLFETMKGMAESEQIMEALFENETYRTHVRSRQDVQTIMLGFSDGTKDGGYLKANWSIFKSKETLTSVCQKYNVSAVFFDGRGGPPARGGGKTHNFYAALGSGISNEEIQMTIQGQTITSTYGTKEKFQFNAEQLITSGLMGELFKTDADFNSEERALIEELSEISYKKYTELKMHPKFLDYLEKMTTLKYYSKAQIGSRPSKRNSDKKLTLSDLRAIAYVGSWSQLKQNVPGYFGLGTAFTKLKEEGRLDEVKGLYQHVPFFKTLIDNSMMSLTKCFFEITSYMKLNNEFKDFWIYLYEEYKLSKQMILEVTGFEELMENEAVTKDSIRIREEIVLPLILIQNYALQMIQDNPDLEFKSVYEKLVIRSLYGNINASRNSA